MSRQILVVPGGDGKSVMAAMVVGISYSRHLKQHEDKVASAKKKNKTSIPEPKPFGVLLSYPT